MTRTKRITIYALLIALALVLSYVEGFIPVIAVPGVKLGLTNIVVIVALYKLGEKDALIISLIRVLLIFLLFSNAASFFYSLAGALLSFVVMVLMKKSKKFSMISVSICGAVSHNVAQILVAMLIFETTALFYYFIVLWFTGILAGFVIGIISYEIVKRLPDFKR